MYAEDSFIKVLQLFKCKFFRKKVISNWMEMYTFPQARHGIAEYDVMIKCKMRNFVKRKPLSFFSIITSFDILNLNKSEICYCDDSFSWISVRVRISVKLFDISGC